MIFYIGDYVSRNSHHNDLLFKIKQINNQTVILEGVEERLIADCDINDLKKEIEILNDDFEKLDKIYRETNLNRDEFFYLPGKILHIDGDKEYLERCMNLYKKMNILSYGIVVKENEISDILKNNLKKTNPDILVITGHDARISDDNYKNSDNFIKAIKKAREYEKSQDKLIIVAGACQSNYEELIKAGANFASSPKRINVHALDPAIIATKVSLSEKNKPINLKKIIESTKYKEEGFGGIITNGTMFQGYPR